MDFHSRADWMARPPKSRRAMPSSQVTHLFLHHAAGTYKSGAEAMRTIQRFHQDTRGWADYAYNWGVWDDGSIWEGRGWGAQGGHTKGWNTRSVAVCYMGDGSGPVPRAALDAIRTVADEADRHFGRALVRQGHRDVGSTACPGDWLYGWLCDALIAPAPPVVDHWANRPSWVPKRDWQRLVDWLRVR